MTLPLYTYSYMDSDTYNMIHNVCNDCVNKMTQDTFHRFGTYDWECFTEEIATEPFICTRCKKEITS